ncbi:hypothetical protein LOD99_14460 [Oopsacas minuta]|uniref:Uncharacterized protein n=1 Tax=Oopsacas minuta TaxID=111878 RepID=A0AAV7KES1_9METZ|nr:hypothetical protein LOD99_14460 [Oopsacas minuta]
MTTPRGPPPDYNPALSMPTTDVYYRALQRENSELRLNLQWMTRQRDIWQGRAVKAEGAQSHNCLKGVIISLGVFMETVIEYYEQGIEQWEEFDASLQLSGDELCNLCDGGCQEFIQNKLEQIAEQIEEMRVQPIELDNRTSRLHVSQPLAYSDGNVPESSNNQEVLLAKEKIRRVIEGQHADLKAKFDQIRQSPSEKEEKVTSVQRRSVKRAKIDGAIRPYIPEDYSQALEGEMFRRIPFPPNQKPTPAGRDLVSSSNHQIAPYVQEGPTNQLFETSNIQSGLFHPKVAQYTVSAPYPMTQLVSCTLNPLRCSTLLVPLPLPLLVSQDSFHLNKLIPLLRDMLVIPGSEILK